MAFCAQYIGAKNGLNDESWSNEIYKMSFNRAKFQSDNENSKILYSLLAEINPSNQLLFILA